MKQFPIIETERLILSRLEEGDLSLVTAYLQDKIFSDLTSNIPYPYTEEHAAFWLKMAHEAFESEKGYIFAIRNKEGKIMGAIGLHDEGADKAELGFWLAKPFWNSGYVTEAARAVVNFGFKDLHFNKIYATHFLHNPSSGRIMEKIGMEKEALLKQHLKKDGEYFDVPLYSIFRNKK